MPTQKDHLAESKQIIQVNTERRKDCRKVVDFLDCLLVKQLKWTKSGYRNSWDGHIIIRNILQQPPSSSRDLGLEPRSDPLQKGLSDLCGTFQWSSFSVVGPWADRYKWSDFTPRSVLINRFFLGLFHAYTWILQTLLLTGFWLHPCSGYTLPSYHRFTQARGLHLPAPRAPEATWDDWTQDLSRSLADQKMGVSPSLRVPIQNPLQKTKDLTPPPIPSHPSNCWEGIWTLKYTQKKIPNLKRCMTGCSGYIQFLWDTPPKKKPTYSPDLIISHFLEVVVENLRVLKPKIRANPIGSMYWHIYLHFRYMKYTIHGS